MKELYYRVMSRITAEIAWFWFMVEPTNRVSGKWYDSHLYYERKLSMLKHPSNG